VFATVGVHPTDWEEGFDEEEFEELISHPKVVGVGECGLDYFRIEADDKKTKDKQRDLFIRHIEFANQHEKPLMIHGRPKAGSMDAYEDIINILLDSGFKINESEFLGNIHFFVGNTEIARKFLDMGFTISFDGPITFTREYDEVIKYVPLERIMAETDAPFAAPVPYRGKRNSPLYIKEIYKAIAEIRGEDPEIVRNQLTQNALNYWNL
jgi:TatD DNase family protein